MDPIRSLQVGRELLDEYRLYDWQIKLDTAKNRLGQCRYSTKTISISRAITWLNEETKIRNTILHEITHALVGRGCGHGPIWRQKAIEIGCDGKRLSDNHISVPKRYTVSCGRCGKNWQQDRINIDRLSLMWHRSCGEVAKGMVTVTKNESLDLLTK